MATTTQTVNGKSKPKSGASRTNALGGFIVNKLDDKVMRAYVKARDLEIDTTLEAEQLGVALAMHLKESASLDDQVRCDNCQAISSAADDSCPFCGDDGDVDGNGESEEARAADDDGDAHQEDVEPEIEEAEAAEDDVEIAAAPEPPPPAPKAEKKAREKKASPPAKSTALAAEPASTVLETAQTLDTQVADVKRLVKKVNDSTVDAAESYWQLGQKLLEINASQSWKLRVDDKGKRAYKSWDSFVGAELGMSLDQAYRAIEVAKEYDTPTLVREIGQTKAAMLLRAAPEDRPALEKAAREGASVRQLHAGVQESRAKHGAPKQTQQSKAGAKSAATRAGAKKSGERVSMAMFEGTVTVKLYKKPESLRGLEWPPEKRAKALGDTPFGRHEMANGLVQYVSIIKDKNGELVAKIQTVREDE